jgi:hypothetical protein
VGAVVAVLVGCSQPGEPDRAVPRRMDAPTFLSVTNAASAPMLVGSPAATYISRDAGRRWTVLRPKMAGATAVSYGFEETVISQGHAFSLWNLDVTRFIRTANWPFPGNVTALASDVRHQRTWAIATGGGTAGPRLYYSNDSRRRWYQYPAVYLCPHPLAIAAIAGRLRPAHVRLFVACGRQGLMVSDDLGYTFQKVKIAATQVLDVATSAGDPGRVVIVTPNVQVSSDGGLTFQGTGLSAVRAAIDPRDANLIFAIGQNGKLYASTDGGKSF